jgi:hypothetical protein
MTRHTGVILATAKYRASYRVLMDGSKEAVSLHRSYLEAELRPRALARGPFLLQHIRKSFVHSHSPQPQFTVRDCFNSIYILSTFIAAIKRQCFGLAADRRRSHGSPARFCGVRLSSPCPRWLGTEMFLPRKPRQVARSDKCIPGNLEGSFNDPVLRFAHEKKTRRHPPVPRR